MTQTFRVNVVLGLCWLLMPLNLDAAPPKPHHRHATLDARVGVGHIDGATFDVLAMYLGVSTFYFGLGFYEESQARKSPDSMPIEALELAGIRSRRLLQMPLYLALKSFVDPVSGSMYGSMDNLRVV